MSTNPDPKPAPVHESAVEDPYMSGLIGGTLRWGVIISALVAAAGYLLLIRSGLPTRAFHHYTGHVTPGRFGVLDVLMNLGAHSSAADIVTVGLVLLVLTPVVRVAMSFFIFIKEHDRLYAWLTLLVFAILISSLLGFTSG